MTKQATIQSSQSGQILVLVILVSLVALSAGLSLASRTITNIKSSGNLDQSNRAFSAAEAGVEHALGQLKAGGGDCSTSCSPTVGTANVTVKVANVGGTTGQAYGSSAVNQDDDIQLNLAGYTGESFDLYWSTHSHASAQNTSPAVEVSVLYCNANPCTSSSTYGLAKVAADQYASFRSGGGDGFNYFITSNNPTDILSVPPGSGLPTGGTGSGQYGFKTTINLSNGSLDTTKYPKLIPAGNFPVLARVRLMYYGPDPVAMVPEAAPPGPVATSFPTQGKQITSTANVNGKQRTVTVFQSSPQLPAIFDYAIFNGSTTALTK